jgi:hypothetical protein
MVSPPRVSKGVFSHPDEDAWRLGSRSEAQPVSDGRVEPLCSVAPRAQSLSGLFQAAALIRPKTGKCSPSHKKLNKFREHLSKKR